MTGPHLLETVRDAVLRRDFATAERVLLEALHDTPRPEFQRALAGVYRHTGRMDQAITMLSTVLHNHPGDVATALGLATLYRDRGHVTAAVTVLRTCLAQGTPDADLAIAAARLCSECDHNADALAIIERALPANPDSARLHVRAAMLCMQLGRFEQARRHYLDTLAQPAQACEWHVPAGMASAQRYSDASHPDLARFRALYERTDLSEKARASLGFALGKAHDDLSGFAVAADYFREANARVRQQRRWNRKLWQRAVSSLLAQPARPPLPNNDAADVTPVLIVGMPRSGSTLAAKLLAQHPEVCNRGELPWLGKLMQQPELAGSPSVATLQATAAKYRGQLLRDDSTAHWIIDKQPFNFRYVDMFLTMFPHARIIHCERSPRDVALSLWTQSFSDDIMGFACDFADIAVVMRDCDRLLARATVLHPNSIRRLRYEDLVSRPQSTLADLAAWLGLPALKDNGSAASTQADNISTASLWQARQPIHQRSVARWRNYLPYVPELAAFKAEDSLRRPNHHDLGWNSK